MQINGYMQSIIGLMILGSMGIFVKWIDLPPPVILFYRVFFASIAMFIMLKARGRSNVEPKLPKKDKALLVISGAAYATALVLLFYSYMLTKIADTIIIATPIFLPLLAHIFLKEKIGKITITALSLSVLGVLVIFSNHQVSLANNGFIGLSLAFASSIIASIWILCIKKLSRNIATHRLNFYNMCISTALLIPALFLFKYTLSISKLLLLLTIGVIHTALALTLFLEGVKRIKAQHSGLIVYIEPFSAMIYAIMVFLEMPSAYTIAGWLLILSGIFIITRYGNSRQIRTQAASSIGKG